MATRKAITIFNRAKSNIVMHEKLSAIVHDDRWRKSDRSMNNEIAEWAFQWAKQAFTNYNFDAPSLKDAATIMSIASHVLQWCVENR